MSNIHNNGTENGLTGDSYVSIAFRGQSAEFLNTVIEEVTLLQSMGRPLYPPSFATYSEPDLEFGLSIFPKQNFHPPITPAEAIALKVIAIEGTAIVRSLLWSAYKISKINKLAGNSHGWPYDLVEGMADFGFTLYGALNIRQRIVDNEEVPTGRTIGDENTRFLLAEYEECLFQDNNTIGVNTVSKVFENVLAGVERHINYNPQGAKTEKEIQDRKASRKRGIELAADMYLQVYEVAVENGFSTSLYKVELSF